MLLILSIQKSMSYLHVDAVSKIIILSMSFMSEALLLYLQIQ